MRISGLALLLILLNFSCTQDKSNSEPDNNASSHEYLELGVMCGTVQFEDGCSEKIDSLISFGLALVHHMTYEDAEYNFNKVIEEDPDCFWGHWGKALTYIHPLWPDQPSTERLNSGISLASKALKLAENEKDSLYGQALAAYYHNGLMKSEKERLKAYEQGWQRVHERFPDDIEAKLFHGLSRLSTVSPNDQSYQVQKEVGAMAESVLEVIADHPGGFHYAIHAYDFPPLANEAIRVAKNYSSIAPDIPHALHMPTHIFTRLGYWDESIEGNRKSAAAAKRMSVNGPVSLHYLHALDYLTYAYLQQSRKSAALSTLTDVEELNPPIQNNGASAYALAAIPARIELENQNWSEAAQLEILHSEDFPWNKYPQFLAIHYFAKGVGAAKAGNPELTKSILETLDSLYTDMRKEDHDSYWLQQVEIQKLALEGLYHYSLGDKAKAINILNQSALLEDGTTKSPVTPGELLPAREILADIYLEEGKAKEALENFQLSLKRNPNRYNTLLGAARAAEKMKDNELAAEYFTSLLKLSEKSEIEREGISYAEEFLGKEAKEKI